MKKIQILLALVFICSIAFCQQNLGITIDGGVSKISSSLVFNNSTWDVKSAPSVNAGVFYTIKLSEYSVIRTEFLFMQINGKILSEMDINGPNEIIIGHVSSNITKNLSYIGFPIYYGVKLNGLTFQIGIQASIFLTGTYKEKSHLILNGEEEYINNTNNDLAISFYDYGPKTSLLYNINDKFIVSASYYFGINNIAKKFAINDLNKIQQATLGLKYIIINK